MQSAAALQLQLERLSVLVSLSKRVRVLFLYKGRNETKNSFFPLFFTQSLLDFSFSYSTLLSPYPSGLSFSGTEKRLKDFSEQKIFFICLIWMKCYTALMSNDLSQESIHGLFCLYCQCRISSIENTTILPFSFRFNSKIHKTCNSSRLRNAT